MELSLDSNMVFVPEAVSEFLSQVSVIKDGAQRSVTLEEYVRRLEDEMRKIEVFKRELPLCMVILKDTIERLKGEVMQCGEVEDRVAEMEEFIPMKKKTDENGGVVSEKENSDMKSWMSSAQLWSTSDYTNSELKPRNEEGDRSVPENPFGMSNKRSRGGAFVPFKGNYESGFARTTCVKEVKDVSQVPSLSLMTPMSGSNNANSKNSTGGGCGASLVKLQIEPQQQSQLQQQQCFRKQRRCWSPELHRRFVDALQQLGGSQVATPKQIRELMQVDGLTNDEVKSHLQKYRLHVRKVPASSAGEANGLWMNQDHSSDHSKANTSQSGSPQGPLLGTEFAKGGQSTTGGDSTETEEDDQKSEGHSWKGRKGHATTPVVMYKSHILNPP